MSGYVSLQHLARNLISIICCTHNRNHAYHTHKMCLSAFRVFCRCFQKQKYGHSQQRLRQLALKSVYREYTLVETAAQVCLCVFVFVACRLMVQYRTVGRTSDWARILIKRRSRASRWYNGRGCNCCGSRCCAVWSVGAQQPPPPPQTLHNWNIAECVG